MIRLLIIEDDEIDVDIFSRTLKRYDTNLCFELIHAETLAKGIAYAKSDDFHAIILDLTIPDGFGLDMILKIRTAGISIPIFIHSGNEDPNQIEQAKKIGAKDYLVKANFDVAVFVEQLKHS